MFDDFSGVVHCLHCGKETAFYEQFKWSDCIMQTYELGDYVDGSFSSYHIEPSNTHCDHCHQEFLSCAVLREGVVIAFLNEKEKDTISLDDIPTPEEGYGKKLRYLVCIEKGEGQSREYEDFTQHPVEREGKLVALNTEWKVEEVYLERIVETDSRKVALLQFMGGFGRRSTDSYVYQVSHERFGERWIKVQDREPYGCGERGGNMHVYKTYTPYKGYALIRI